MTDLPQRLRRQAELLEEIQEAREGSYYRGMGEVFREAFEAGATQQQIATAYGVSQQYISKLLKKEEKP